MLNAGCLIEAFKLCQNFDYGMRLYHGFKALASQHYSFAQRDRANLIVFLGAMLPIYGESGVAQIVESAESIQIWDCARLYLELSDENRQAIATEKVKIKELHDWMAKRHKMQKHQNIKFNIPEHIIKRMSMQTDRLKFFLPKESMDLLEAGVELQNCVATYSGAVRANTKQIVLVADDRGKLTACLEIQSGQLVQAKLSCNHPVYTNPELNTEIVAWTKEAKLAINTRDIKTPVEVANAAAVS
jgi:hypothetical protein